MIIVLASDNNFVQHCAVTMVSVLKNNSEVKFYLLTEGLTAANIDLLNKLVSSNGGELVIVEIPSVVVNKFPMPVGMSTHISIATYYRLFVSDIIPNDVDKIIYLDCDIVVRKSLNDLWELNLDGYALGAVYQYNDWSDSNMTWNRLCISRELGYFNAGVLLINLAYWRANNIQNKLFNYIAEHYDSIRSHDQDVLNAVLCGNALPLNYTWNFLPFLFDDYSRYSFPYKKLIENIESIKKDPAVVHFVYKPKPWQCGCTNPFRKDYFKYLEFTPFKSFKPQFILTLWWSNRVWRPFMVRMGKLKRAIYQF